jgi:hypothetical protein
MPEVNRGRAGKASATSDRGTPGNPLDSILRPPEDAAMTTATSETFKVWAGDDRAYGPVDGATLTHWIKDDRVFPETFVQFQSDGRWSRADNLDALRVHFPAAGTGGGSASRAVATADDLRALTVFENLSDAALEQLAALGECFEIAPPSLVVRTGDACDAVYFVLAGQLRVRLVVGIVDKQDKTLCTLGPGEFFGELGMFLQSKRTADVLAESPSRLFRLSTNAFQLIVKQLPELASPILFNIGVTMAKRIAEDNQRFYREVTSQFLWA